MDFTFAALNCHRPGVLDPYHHPGPFYGNLVWRPWAADGMTFTAVFTGLLDSFQVYVLNAVIDPNHAAIMLFTFMLVGKKVRTLIQNRFQYAGEHKVLWNGTNDSGIAVASGVYFYRMKIEQANKESNSASKTRKLILLR